MKKERFDMRISEHILKEVEEYQKSNGISTKTAAFLELVRIGLQNTKKRSDN